MELLRAARVQLTELTGMEAESISSFVKREDVWSLEVEVLELARVPRDEQPPCDVRGDH